MRDLIIYIPRCVRKVSLRGINPLNDELNPICHLVALLGTRHILHVSKSGGTIRTERRPLITNTHTTVPLLRQLITSLLPRRPEFSLTHCMWDFWGTEWHFLLIHCSVACSI
jgi:hypothetical protein